MLIKQDFIFKHCNFFSIIRTRGTNFLLNDLSVLFTHEGWAKKCPINNWNAYCDIIFRRGKLIFSESFYYNFIFFSLLYLILFFPVWFSLHFRKKIRHVCLPNTHDVSFLSNQALLGYPRRNRWRCNRGLEYTQSLDRRAWRSNDWAARYCIV